MNLAEKSEYWSEHFKGLDFSAQAITAIDFEGCTFKGCDFSEATFNKCNFVDCEFINCNLSLVNIAYSKFSEVYFRESKLIGVNWTKAWWSGLLLSSPIKFYRSILNDSSFYGLAMKDLVLEECKAHDVDFREGDFSCSNFTYTDLSGSLFSNSNLSGADFSEASNYDINIYQNAIKQAKFSRFEAVRLLDSLEIELVD
ncbi:pentapeptide repeat-containing protein [Dasania marina]|uniref:pentapeptide repeat-containing protein n=1 Tax=Dasania marina TaxID=471499 RepID=UPI0030DCF526